MLFTPDKEKALLSDLGFVSHAFLGTIRPDWRLYHVARLSPSDSHGAASVTEPCLRVSPDFSPPRLPLNACLATKFFERVCIVFPDPFRHTFSDMIGFARVQWHSKITVYF